MSRKTNPVAEHNFLQPTTPLLPVQLTHRRLNDVSEVIARHRTLPSFKHLIVALTLFLAHALSPSKSDSLLLSFERKRQASYIYYPTVKS
ncbi:hypothetical protein [Endozoicomonas euniceicola]|uniref:Uncharacterized protein n=1 Tax=Endozoicomonas euniceicola TaxID=1234143 RepID=A0ABY6GPB4_9GAMM|nr:hypothetical protein [Endozoicomonas euniceicola]UYM14598.1 hypothetical protein NX720_17095 [Endozoicomonas euniceicola]